MTIEKRGNTYRITEMVNGKRYRVNIRHKPTKAEARLLIEDLMIKSPEYNSPTLQLTFEDAMNKYNAMKEPVLSPSTIKDYFAMNNRIADWFKKKKISDISLFDMQNLINEYTPGHAEKTVKNLNGYVQSVLKAFRTGFTGFKVDILKTIKEEPYIPTSDEVKQIVKASVGTSYEYTIALACYGLRRSEAAAITRDDIDLENSTVTINKSLVYNRHHEWVTKPFPKTSESIRVVVIDPQLAKAIYDKGKACTVHPANTLKWLQNTCDKLGIQRFPLHKMRHWVATELHESGLPEADILKYCGWSQSGDVMRAVYRHARIDKDKEKAKLVSNTLTNLIK